MPCSNAYIAQYVGKSLITTYIFFISILMYNVFTHKRYKESVGMRRIEDSQTHNTYSKHLTTFMYRVNGQNTQSKMFNLI